MPHPKTFRKLNEDHWLYHIEHLSEGLIFQMECKVCNLKKQTVGTLGKIKDFISVDKSMKFYDAAVKSGRKSISIKEVNGK
jgi:C4-type Zn-finger protein